MIDLRQLREDAPAVLAALARRGHPAGEVERVVALDEEQRRLATERDELRNRIKSISKEIGRLRRDGHVDEAEDRQAESRRLGDEERRRADEAAAKEAEIRRILLETPNVPSPDAPDGAGPDDNVVLRVEGHDPDRYQDHHRVPHWETGAALGILDLERAAKISGSMFVMFRGEGARLARALCQLALDRNRDVYEEIRPPTLVRTETMVSTGHLPKFDDEAYHVERDDLWAVPTAEVPLTSLARNEVLDEGELPLRLMAHTSCFRREAGAAGRDTRGLLRVHEFDKVELLAVCTADQAAKVHDEILERAERALGDLGLPYRVVDLCAGDLGGSAARTYDLEVYAPGVDQWLECSSVSWFGDYQARRAAIRYRPAGGKGTEVAHTLNGSALAVPRVWAALVENHRQPDGSVLIPEPLRPYMDGVTTISPVAGDPH